MEDLQQLREQIDSVDNKLLELIASRLTLVKKVGEIKKSLGRQVRDPQREEDMLEKLGNKGESFGLAKSVVKKIWQTFFEVSYDVEK